MSVQVLSDIAAALTLVYSKPCVNNIKRGSVLLSLLPFMLSTDKTPSGTAKFSGASNPTGTAEGARKAYSDASHEIEIPFTGAWAIYDGVISVSERAQAITRGNVAPQSVGAQGGSLLKGRVLDKYERIILGVGAHLYSGSSSNQIVGVATAIDGTGTYEGIDPSTYTEWVSAENTLAETSLSFTNLGTYLIDAIRALCNEKPTFIVTTPTVHRQIKALYGSTAVPYVSEMEIPGANAGDGRVTPDRVVRLSAGADVINFEGTPIVADSACTANTLYGINTRYMYMQQLPYVRDEMFDVDRMTAALREAVGNPNLPSLGPNVVAEIRALIQNPNGLIPYFKQLGASGSSDELLVSVDVQLMCSRRNAHGKLTLT